MIEITHDNHTEVLDAYDSVEVTGCIDTGEYVEICFEPDAVPSFWTVYGHYRSGGVCALWDCATEAEAHTLALRCQDALKDAGFLRYIYPTGQEVTQ